MVAALVRIALRRPYTFIVLAILIALFGMLAALRMATDIFPDIDIPVIAVAWTYTRPVARRHGGTGDLLLRAPAFHWRSTISIISKASR